jgi:uncharacterized membrane protein
LTALVLPLLDIRVDETGGWGKFWDANGAQLGAFLLGFFVIAVFWAVHHKVWGTARAATSLLLWLNMGWLLGIVLIPFGTIALNESGSATPILGAQIYCAIMILTSVMLGLITYVVANDPRIRDGEMTPQPLLWTLRLGIWWVFVWGLLLVSASLGFTLMTMSGIAMAILGSWPSPGSKRYRQQHPGATF